MSPTTLRVFEHQTLRVGEALLTANGRSVSLTDAQLDALARFNDAHGGRYFVMGYRRVTFTQHVGYLQVGRLGIEVLPKADRRPRSPGAETEWRDALLSMLRLSLGIRLHSPAPASQHVGRSSLLELVALKFVQEVEQLLREGLAKGYRALEANGTAFRGRLMVAQNLRENLARADRFYVKFPSFDHHTLPNRVLRRVLDTLRTLPLASELNARVMATQLQFPEVEVGCLSASDLDGIQLGRATARYGPALTLARMLLEHEAPTLRSGKASVFALLFDMNLLWERYVTAVLRRAAPAGMTVHAQESQPFWRATPRPARLVRPDVVVRQKGKVVLIVDAKWKLLRGQPSIDELQQMFVYNELLGSARAVLVYPGTEKPEMSGAFHSREHSCGVLVLDALAQRPEDEVGGVFPGA